jgi:transposase
MERSTMHLLAKRGKSQREIARELGVSRVTVSRVLAEPVDRQPSKRNRSSSVDPFAEQIERWLNEKLTGVRMLELARSDPNHPYVGGRSVFSEYVRKVRLERDRVLADVPVRFEGLPGEYLQVDWGEVRSFPFTHAKHGTRYFLACRLKYSRWAFVRWTTRMDQETLLRLLVDCFLEMGFVPWVLVFDNMKTVTVGRDADNKPIWHPLFLQFAREFDFHPEACTVGAPNQKGAVESLVKWAKVSLLPGRTFVDDADLDRQTLDWLAAANSRPSSATNEPPNLRLKAEILKGGRLPASAADYGFPESARVNTESLVHLRGNTYSVPVAHVGAPVTVRVHLRQVVIWRDTVRLAEHKRAPNSARQRVIDPAHFAPLFEKKPRARMMLQRQALLELGESAASFVAEVSRRQRNRLNVAVTALYALYEKFGRESLLTAMTTAVHAGTYSLDYLELLLERPKPDEVGTPILPSAPMQSEVDRQLSSYEEWVIDAESSRTSERLVVVAV